MLWSMAEVVVAMGKRVNKRVKLQGEIESDTKRAFFDFCGVWKILYGHKTRLRAKRMRFSFSLPRTTDSTEFFPGISKIRDIN